MLALTAPRTKELGALAGDLSTTLRSDCPWIDGGDVDYFHRDGVTSSQFSRLNPFSVGSVLRSLSDRAIRIQERRPVALGMSHNGDVQGVRLFGAHHGDNIAIYLDLEAEHSRYLFECNVTT